MLRADLPKWMQTLGEWWALFDAKAGVRHNSPGLEADNDD
jgi:hypothetical protein